MTPPRFVVRRKTELLLGAWFLTGVAFGLVVLRLPSSSVAATWLARALKFGLGTTTVVNGAVVTLLCIAVTILPTRYRNSVLLGAGARVAAKFVAPPCLRAASLLLGLSCIIAYTHDWHAFASVLSAAIWFIALRRLTIENATGAPNLSIASACAGWLIGVAFQPSIGHFVGFATHLV
jgi:hypothetical protein